MTSSIRAFISVDMEDEEILHQIQAVQHSFPMFRAVKPYQFHFTLKFLGDVPAREIVTIKENLTDLKKGPFKITLGGLGTFPKLTGRKRPSYVLWIGVTKQGAEMRNLAGMVEEILGKFGFERERRPYNPHLTIGRGKRLNTKDISSAHQTIMDYQDIEIGEFNVTSIRLKKSTLTPKGPIYEILSEVKLL